MYHRVVKLVSTTKNDNPDVLFVLLTKVKTNISSAGENQVGALQRAFHPECVS